MEENIGVKDTSLIAYLENEIDGTHINQADRILNHLSINPFGLTRNEVSRNLSIPINAVAGRVRELVKQKVIFECGKRIDKFSNKKNMVVKLI